MKTQLLILLAFGFAVLAAPPLSNQLCVTLSDADMQRVLAAYSDYLKLKDANFQPRPATIADVEAELLQHVQGITHDYELRQHMETFTPPPTIMSITAPTPEKKKK